MSRVKLRKPPLRVKNLEMEAKDGGKEKEEREKESTNLFW